MNTLEFIDNANKSLLYVKSEPASPAPLSLLGKLKLRFFQDDNATFYRLTTVAALSGGILLLPVVRQYLHSLDIDWCLEDPFFDTCPSGTSPFGHVCQDDSVSFLPLPCLGIPRTSWIETSETHCLPSSEVIYSLTAIAATLTAAAVGGDPSHDIETAHMNHTFQNVLGQDDGHYVLTIRQGNDHYLCERINPYVYVARIGNTYQRIIGDRLEIAKHKLSPDYLRTRNQWQTNENLIYPGREDVLVEGEFQPIYPSRVNGECQNVLVDGTRIVPATDNYHEVETVEWQRTFLNIEGTRKETLCTNMRAQFTRNDFHLDGRSCSFRTTEGYQVLNDGHFGNMAIEIQNRLVLANYGVHPVTGQEYVVYRRPDWHLQGNEGYSFTELHRNPLYQKRAS